MFCVGGLVEKGDEFVTAMYDDEPRSLRSRGQFVLDKVAPLEGQGAEFSDKLRVRLEELKVRRPKAKLLNPKDAASASVMEKGYLCHSLRDVFDEYRVLSRITGLSSFNGIFMVGA